MRPSPHTILAGCLIGALVLPVLRPAALLAQPSRPGESARRTIAIEYINASTARNKREIEERDPVERRKTQDALRATAADPAQARAYLRKTSMLDALARAEAIA